MERFVKERNYWKKGTRQNDLAKDPRSRTEQNDWKKVGTCPALGVTCIIVLTGSVRKQIASSILSDRHAGKKIDLV